MSFPIHLQVAHMRAQTAYGVSWDENADTYTRTGDISAIPVSQSAGTANLKIHAEMKRCLMNDAGVVQYYPHADDSTLKADGITASDLTGGDGQVLVQIKAFWYKYGYAGTTHTWDIANYAKDGYTLHTAFVKNGENVDYRYIGAYEGVAYDNSASAYVDGVSFPGDTGADKLSSVSGFAPWTDETRGQMRLEAANRGTGWRQQDFDLVSAIQLLYLVEYADWNSQAMIGAGRTQLSGGSWVKDSYIGVTGKSNADGNGTNSVDGNTNDAYMTYRGIENFFGNVWKWVDGININDNVPYVSNTDTDFADDTATGYTALGITLPNTNGYQVLLEQQARGFLPASVGGSSSTYITDYYYQAVGWRGVKLGGSASTGARAGVAFWAATDASSHDHVDIGGRLSY